MARMEGDDAPEPQGCDAPMMVPREPGATANAPWWLLSAGLHVVLLLATTLIYVDRMMSIDEGETIVSVAPKAATIINEIERPRDDFERKGIPKDDGASAPSDEPAIFFP